MLTLDIRAKVVVFVFIGDFMTGKRYLDRVYPYLINYCEDGYYLTDCNGFMLNSEELMDIGKNLIKYAKKHNTEDILKHNQKIKYEFENMMTSFVKSPRKMPKGYIYIMECDNKHKIGTSKNVEQRQKELDNKPFKTNIIYKSELIEDVYTIERNLHKVFSDKRIYGEWFKLTKTDIEYIKKSLEL